jgi:hypothetical protein
MACESSNQLDSLRLLYDKLQTKLQQVQDTLQQAELKQANNNSTNSTSSKRTQSVSHSASKRQKAF